MTLLKKRRNNMQSLIETAPIYRSKDYTIDPRSIDIDKGIYELKITYSDGTVLHYDEDKFGSKLNKFGPFSSLYLDLLKIAKSGDEDNLEYIINEIKSYISCELNRKIDKLAKAACDYINRCAMTSFSLSQIKKLAELYYDLDDEELFDPLYIRNVLSDNFLSTFYNLDEMYGYDQIEKLVAFQRDILFSRCFVLRLCIDRLENKGDYNEISSNKI
jgi:hypothetical protein